MSTETQFKKGKEKGPGRPKGMPNKTPAAIKEMILQALSNAGGVEYLERRANDPRTAAAFLGLVGKVLPLQIAGDPNNPLQTVTRIELVAPSANRTA